MQAEPAPISLTTSLVIVTGSTWMAAAVTGVSSWAAAQAGFIPLRFSEVAYDAVIPAYVTPFTATLVHGGLYHIALNLIMLAYCGKAVEKVIGPASLAILYAAGALGAAVAQFLVDPQSPVPMIGASGAISAIIAVYALLFSRNEVKSFGPIPSHWVRALWLAAAWTGVQWLIGVTAAGGGSYQVATAAHVGGFLVGLALARPLLAWRYRGA